MYRVGFDHIYLISDGVYTKVGYSNNPVARLRTLQTARPDVRLRLLTAVEADKEVEVLLHEELEPYHHAGEWYLLDEAGFYVVSRFFAEMELDHTGW